MARRIPHSHPFPHGRGSYCLTRFPTLPNHSPIHHQHLQVPYIQLLVTVQVGPCVVSVVALALAPAGYHYLQVKHVNHIVVADIAGNPDVSHEAEFDFFATGIVIVDDRIGWRTIRMFPWCAWTRPARSWWPRRASHCRRGPPVEGPAGTGPYDRSAPLHSRKGPGRVVPHGVHGAGRKQCRVSAVGYRVVREDKKR